MKRIWITDGGSGIGAEMAKIFLFLKGRKTNLKKVSPNVTIIPCDITSIKHVKKAIKNIINKVKTIKRKSFKMLEQCILNRQNLVQHPWKK